MGDLLSFAYPEMVKRIFPETFNKERHKATVEVRLQVQSNKFRVYGKIAALIKDNTSSYFRVGSMLLALTEGLDELICSNSDVKVRLERSAVVVPSGWVLCIDVDLHVKTGNNGKTNNLKGRTVDFNSNTDRMKQYGTVRGDNNSDKVHVTVTWCPELHSEDIGKQLSPPVEVIGMASLHPTIVYTIGDELSFIEFIMALRRILADHGDPEDILDGHRLLNLSSTREHPVLAKQRSEEPYRWIQVKLQVVEANKTSSSTTLFMKADNVYVHGFMNHQEVVYELLLNPRSRQMLPQEYRPKPLYWDLKYRTILGAKGNDAVLSKLKDAELGRDFAKKAVHVLSRYDRASASPDDEKYARLALASLIFMIAESARMNSIFKSFACGWNSNNGFTEQLMRYYAWEYAEKSRKLREWKRRQYAEPVLLQHYPVKELDAIYLVLNTGEGHAEKEENDNNHHPKPEDDDPGNDNLKRGRETRNDDRTFSWFSSQPNNTGSVGRHGYDGRHDDRHRKRARNDDCCGGPQSQQEKAGNAAGRGGDPASKSKEVIDASSSGGPASYPGNGEAGDAGTGGGSPNPIDKTGGGSAGSQQDKTADYTSGGGGSANQPGGTYNTGSGSGGGSARQPNGTGNADPSGGSSGSQPREADGAKYNGRPRVEILTMAIRANLMVVGMTVVVFDGKRGQTIYEEEQGQHNKEEQGDQGGWEDLVLTGPYVGISAYGCFVIRIETPALAAPIRWEWDCYRPEYAAQVDKSHVTQHIDDVAKATYAVMSNAREATVQVKLRLKGGHIPNCVSGGNITALIDGFDARSVLFNKHAQGTGQCLSPTYDDDSWFLLQLARNVVAVPCGSALAILVNLQIETDDGKQVPLNVPLSFENGICSSKSKTNDDGNEVEVEVTWYPEITRLDETREEIDQPHLKLPTEITRLEETLEEIDKPKLKLPAEDEVMFGKLVEVVHTIEDEVSFTRFITDLRRILAEHRDKEDILDSCPLLSKQHAEQPARWFRIKLQVVKGEEMLSTSLLMRDDNLYVCGFINQNGAVYKLVDNENSESFLPEDHTTTYLQLGVNYKSLLQAKDRNDIVGALTYAKLGRDFAMDAVHVLSRYPDKVDGINNISTGLALAGLIVIFCESARMQPINKAFKFGWKKGKAFNKDLMEKYVWKYGEMSHKLQAWKRRNYAEPHRFSEEEATSLVLNTGRLPHDDYTNGHSRPQVELLAIRADIGVIGKRIIVLDGKRGQIIYRHEKQGEQGRMVDLVLTGPYTGISGYGCFAIRIDMPPPATAPIKWEWDCYDPKYTAQVDGEAVTQTIHNPANRQKVAEVTYAVMSNARQATLQVKLQLNNGHSSPGEICCKISAFIGGFKVPAVLFSGALRTDNDSWFLLPLARNVVAMPYGEILCIEVDLHNETSKKHLKADVYIPDGRIGRRRHVVDGFEVEVDVISFYPEVTLVTQAYPELVYTIGDDEMSYIRFISALRQIIVTDDQPPQCMDLLDGHSDPNVRSNRQHPLLHQYKARRLLHIKLQVAGEETSTILAIRFDDFNVHAFAGNQNKKQVQDFPLWYNNGYMPYDQSAYQKELNWTTKYDRILKVRTEEVLDKLNSERLGKTSAVNAVRVLSRFSYEKDGEAEARLALVRLMVMISDSARMNPVRDAIAGGWNNGTEITKQLMDYIWNWDRISTALVDWKESNYGTWEKDDRLEGIGIKSPEEALHIVHLCSAQRMNRSLSLMDLPSASAGRFIN